MCQWLREHSFIISLLFICFWETLLSSSPKYVPRPPKNYFLFQFGQQRHQGRQRDRVNPRVPPFPLWRMYSLLWLHILPARPTIFPHFVVILTLCSNRTISCNYFFLRNFGIVFHDLSISLIFMVVHFL